MDEVSVHMHKHTHTQSLESFNVVKGKTGRLRSCPPPHRQPAVMSNTTSPGVLDQTPASTVARSVMMVMVTERQGEDFVFPSPSAGPSSLQIGL